MSQGQNELDNRTNQIVSGKAANGNDYAGLQAAQQQLMAIQAEQRQNLNVARAEANNLSAQRNILAQAGAMAAMTSQANQGGPVQGRPLVVNPATQAVLGKFGVGQPKTIRSQNQQVTPQNVVINNNYTTNNNVTVPANIGGPLQGRPLQFNKPQEDSMGKFRNWMSAALAKQSEEAQKRDQEYIRREWSLTRSANKVIKKIEDYAKSFGEKIDPKRIGSTIGSQIKSILLIFGLGVLSANWKKILTTVAKIERNIRGFADYLGIFSDDPGKSRFHKHVIKLLGGTDEDENAYVALKKLFVGDGSGKDGGGVFGTVKMYFEDLIADRKNAVEKALSDKPKVGLNVADSLGNIANYIGGIISAAFTGSKGLANSTGTKIANEGRAEASREFSTQSYRNGGSFRTDSGEKVDTTIGVGSHLAGNSSGRFFEGMYNKNSNEYSVGLGSDITRLIGDAQKGHVKTNQMAATMIDLQNAARNREYVAVPTSLVDSLFSAKEVANFKRQKMVRDAFFRVVAVKKSAKQRELDKAIYETQYHAEYAEGVGFVGDLGITAAMSTITAGLGSVGVAAKVASNSSKVANFVGGTVKKLKGARAAAAARSATAKGIGKIKTAGNVAKKAAGVGTMAYYTADNTIDNFNESATAIKESRLRDKSESSFINRLIGADYSKFANFASEYTTEIRRVPPKEAGGEDVYHLYEINYAMVQEINKRLSGQYDASTDNANFFTGLEQNLLGMSGSKEIYITGGKTQAETWEDYNNMVAEKESRDQLREANSEKNERAQRSKEAIGEVVGNVTNAAKEYGNKVKDALIEKGKEVAANAEAGAYNMKQNLNNWVKNGKPKEGDDNYYYGGSSSSSSSSSSSPSNQTNGKGSIISNSYVNTDRMTKAIDYLKKELGINDVQAAGIVGCLYAESHLNPESINKDEKAGGNPNVDKNYYGAGLPHWTHKERKDKILSYLQETSKTKGTKIEDFGFEDQLRAVAWEIKNDRKTFLKVLKEKQTVEDAADATLRGYENGTTDKLATVDNMGWKRWSEGMYDRTNGRGHHALKAIQVYNEDSNGGSPQFTYSNNVNPTSISVNKGGNSSSQSSSSTDVARTVSNIDNVSNTDILVSMNNNLVNISSKLDYGNEIARVNTEVAAAQVDAINNSNGSKSVATHSAKKEVVRSKTS
jgi:hypothetical protein